MVNSIQSVATTAVLLATYNGEKYITEFLDSLDQQSYQDFMLIVCDDGSSDATLSILNSYSYKLSITILNSTQRLGAARNFMKLLVDSGDNFEYYFFADQDDYWHPYKIERALIKLAEQRNLPTLYCSGVELVDAHLTHISFPPPHRVIGLNNALVENIAIGCTIALNNKARHIVTEKLPKDFSMHDWWVHIVISAFGHVIYDDFTSLKYRQHGGNTIGAATTPYQDLVRRLKRFFSTKKNGVFCIADQAEELYRCYGQHLSNQQTVLVQSLIFGKKTLKGRVKLAFTSSFVRQKPMDTFILKIMLLLGRF